MCVFNIPINISWYVLFEFGAHTQKIILKYAEITKI